MCSIPSSASTIPKRKHSTLDYLSPMEFERQAELAKGGVDKSSNFVCV